MQDTWGAHIHTHIAYRIKTTMYALHICIQHRAQT